MTAIPFKAWLAHAACRLGIAPRAFWQLSLREWQALAGPPEPAPLPRSGLTELLNTYPDTRDDI